MAMQQPTLASFSDWWPKIRDLPLLIPHTITLSVSFHEIISWSHPTSTARDNTIKRIQSLIHLRDSTPYFLCTDCDSLWPNSPDHSILVSSEHISDRLKEVSQHILEIGIPPSFLIVRELIDYASPATHIQFTVRAGQIIHQSLVGPPLIPPNTFGPSMAPHDFSHLTRQTRIIAQQLPGHWILHFMMDTAGRWWFVQANHPS